MRDANWEEREALLIAEDGTTESKVAALATVPEAVVDKLRVDPSAIVLDRKRHGVEFILTMVQNKFCPPFFFDYLARHCTQRIIAAYDAGELSDAALDAEISSLERNTLAGLYALLDDYDPFAKNAVAKTFAVERRYRCNEIALFTLQRSWTMLLEELSSEALDLSTRVACLLSDERFGCPNIPDYAGYDRTQLPEWMVMQGRVTSNSYVDLSLQALKCSDMPSFERILQCVETAFAAGRCYAEGLKHVYTAIAINLSSLDSRVSSAMASLAENDGGDPLGERRSDALGKPPPVAVAASAALRVLEGMERCNFGEEATGKVIYVGLLVPVHMSQDGDDLLRALSHLQRLRISDQLRARVWRHTAMPFLDGSAADMASARNASRLKLNQALAARAAAGDAAGVAAAVKALRHFAVPLLLYAPQTDADVIFTPAARRFVVLQTAQLVSAAAKSGNAEMMLTWSDWPWSLGILSLNFSVLIDEQTIFFALSDDLDALLQRGSAVTASVDRARLALLREAIAAGDAALVSQLLRNAVEKQATGDALRELFAVVVLRDADAAVGAIDAASQELDLAVSYRWQAVRGRAGASPFFSKVGIGSRQFWSAASRGALRCCSAAHVRPRGEVRARQTDMCVLR